MNKISKFTEFSKKKMGEIFPGNRKKPHTFQSTTQNRTTQIQI